MSRPPIPFARPDIGDEEVNEVAETLRSGWLTSGPKVKRFEQDFAAFLGEGVEAVAVSSATAGLHLALEALGIGPGDEVIVPSYTFTATAEVVRYLGADPVFVDVSEATFNIDVDAVALAITGRTRAVIPVHFGGLACDMDALASLAKRHGLRVVEDAAHALPTTSGGTLIGALESSAAVFSFYANKPMTTGEGGMLVTRDVPVAERARLMRLHGITRDPFQRQGAKGSNWRYDVVAPGFKYNMTDVAAAMGIHQLKKLSGFQHTRERIAQHYNAALAKLPLILPANPNGADLHARHLYPVRLALGAPLDRGSFVVEMARRSIECSVHFIPLHLQTYWRDRYGLRPEQFPISQALYESEVSLPLHTAMTDDDLRYVVENVRAVLTVAKRIFDVLLSAAGIVLLLPVYLVLALWVAIDSTGPIFFLQSRVGRGGRPFRIIKFRTMHPHAERHGLLTRSPDPRVTRSGRFMRRWKLDELPQLLNVLKGEMSLVGPRPEVREFFRYYDGDAQRAMLALRPGMTDLASLAALDEEEVLGRSADVRQTYISELVPAKSRHIVAYATNHSVFEDVKIILRTLILVSRR